MKWIAEPLVGLKPLRFGMTPDQVRALGVLGPVSARHPAFDGTVNEFRTMSEPVCGFRDDRLTAVDTSWRVGEVRFEDISVYEVQPALLLQSLERANGGALLGLGSVLFDRLGINVSGFYLVEEERFFEPGKDLDDQRGLALAEAGAYDSVIDEYAPITFF